MNIPKTIRRLTKFMEAQEREVVDLFLTLPDAIELDYKPNQPIVFVPGTRKDRVLLVAHYDTVYADKEKRSIMENGTVLQSAIPGLGIGADNRAGCCMLWMMRMLGHSLIIVPDEEVGCLGSGHMATHHAKYLDDHAYCMQFDRRGYDDLVYYDTETEDFNDYMERNFYGYQRASGSFTDIVELVPAAGVCGVNVSVGFYEEHTSSETLEVCDFIRTAYNTLNLLRKEQPTFPSSYTGWGGHYSGYNYGINSYGLDDPLADPLDDDNTLLFCCPHCGITSTDPTDKELYVYNDPHAICGYCDEQVNMEECTMYEDDLIHNDDRVPF